MKYLRWVAVMMVVLPQTALGQTWRAEPPKGDAPEPVLTEEALPNEVGEWDFRWSHEYRRHVTGSTMHAPRMQAFFGIADRLGGEVDVALVSARRGDRHYGPGDVETTVKWLLLAPHGSVPAITIGWAAGWPTGSAEKGTGEGAVELHPFVALLRDFRSFRVQGDVGWSQTISNEETEHAVPFNWAVALPLGRPRTAVMMEINGRVGLRNEDSHVAIAPGIRHGVGNRASFALAVPIGIASSSDRWGIVSQWQVGF